MPQATKKSLPSWFGFLITLKNNLNFTKNELVEHLEAKNIQTRNLFAGNILKHPLFKVLEKNTDYRVVGKLKNTDKIMNDSFWLGVYPKITDNILSYILNTIKDFINNSKK